MKKYLKPKSDYKLKIGQHIRAWRDIRGIKQKLLAQKLGISAAALSQMENDTTALTLQRIEDIADALEIKPEQLMTNPSTLIDRHHQDASVNLLQSECAPADNLLLRRLVLLMEGMHQFFTGDINSV